MNKTSISWTDYTSNPIRARNRETGKVGHFCEKVSGGCKYCYASEWNEKRYGTGLAFDVRNRDKVEIYLNHPTLEKILRTHREAKVFICDMTDMFADWVTDEWLDRIFAVMAMRPNLTFQVLTKRPERMRRYMAAERIALFSDGNPVTPRNPYHSDDFVLWAGQQLIESLPWEESRRLPEWPIDSDSFEWPLPNVWLGVTAEDQATADERIPILLDTPAAVRFVSYEPAIGALDVGFWTRPNRLIDRPGLSWLICGAESGITRRPFDLQWARDVRDQCAEAGVAFWMKQASSRWPGEYDSLPKDLKVQQFPAMAVPA